jgi:hypothetical protein
VRVERFHRLRALGRHHSQSELAAPVAHAIPAQGAFAGAKPGGKRRFGLLQGQRLRRGIDRGNEIEPEVVVEPQVEERAIKIQQGRIYMVPNELFNLGRHRRIIPAPRKSLTPQRLDSGRKGPWAPRIA